jgi:hypothetical protein
MSTRRKLPYGSRWGLGANILFRLVLLLRDWSLLCAQFHITGFFGAQLQAAKPQKIAKEDELRKIVAAGMEMPREPVVEETQIGRSASAEFVSRALDDLLSRRIDRASIQRMSLLGNGTH